MTTIRKICKYVEQDGTSPVSDFIRRLDWKLQKKVMAQLKQLENPAFALQPPHIKAFRQSRHKGFFRAAHTHPSGGADHLYCQ